MSAILMSALLATAPVEPKVLQARAALAMAFAPVKPTYAASYRRAVAEGKPLIVFVGQPAAAVPDCIVVAVEAFPEAAAPAVIVGVPAPTGLRRIDLPGKPTANAIRAATGRTDANLLLPGRCDGTTNCRKP
ncbi:MAG: hypothetical protein U0791_25595 [Gemmataceae bacterium]